MTTPKETSNPLSPKAFSLRLLENAADPEFGVDEWIWTPHRDLTATDIQTATFSGKNKADDYKNE